MIDNKKYTKECARKKITLLGWFLYYTGACDIVLDYQVWRANFRFWHPLTWFCFVLSCIVNGFSNYKDVFKDMKCKGASYRKIPKHPSKERFE